MLTPDSHGTGAPAISLTSFLPQYEWPMDFTVIIIHLPPTTTLTKSNY
jgi:hypothetical protein